MSGNFEKHRVEELLLRYEPSGDALFDWLRQQVDDSMLSDIAMADYGIEAKKHLQAVRQIRDTGIIPGRLPWEPMEVLQLVRWSEPDAPNATSDRIGRRIHLMRAFCCTVLIKAGIKSEDRRYPFSGKDTTIQLVASTFVLGTDAAKLALRFLGWLVLCEAICEDAIPFYALMILLLALFQNDLSKDSRHIRSLAEWVLMEEYRQRNEWLEFCPDASEAWILNQIFSCYKRETLKHLARKILLEPIVPHPFEAAAILNTIGKRVVKIERR